jgi:uncharacterized protein (TIGR02246 family)
MKHFIYSALSAAVLLVSPQWLSQCVGQEGAKSGSSTSELAAVRASSQAFAAAFNKKDAKALAAQWTEDGDFVDDAGTRLVGRSAIEKSYADYFVANPQAQVRVVIDSIRLLSDSAAIEDGRAFVDPPATGPAGYGKYTAVHVKVDGKWLMSTVRDTRVETLSGYEKVADLEWLIGTWTAEQQGAKTISVCRWVANKSFVERTYTVTKPDQTSTSGLQVIGFNPEQGHLQSWNFSSDGGHAIGEWSPRENGWSTEMRGVTGDGTTTIAVNRLEKLDDNAYVWQSMRRSAGGKPLPDTDEVVFKRKPVRN